MTRTASTAVEPTQPALPTLSRFAELVETADIASGHDLIKDKSCLIGVPFVITGVAYRDGLLTDRGPTNFVSLEIIVADASTLADKSRRGAFQLATLAVRPEESLVINDGGTGIARQITQYLHDKGHINVGDGDDVGPMGTSRFDRYRLQWVDGGDVGTFDVCLYCPRGLRVSEYDNPRGGTVESATYYIG